VLFCNLFVVLFLRLGSSICIERTKVKHSITFSSGRSICVLHPKMFLSACVKPLSHQMAMPQCLYNVLKPCQRAVESPRNTPKISNLSVIACTQRPHSVPTASTQRIHSVFTASMTFFTARKQFLQRVHSAHTAFSRRL